MKKNDEIVLSITDISDSGEGIGRLDGIVYFVKGAIIGDEILAGITKVKKTYSYARLIEIISPSPYRIDPLCEVADKCGGCQIMAMSYDKQLDFKESFVKNCLTRIGGFDSSLINKITHPIVGMDNPYHYRNKAQYPVSSNKNSKLVTGFYAINSHRIIENNGCKIGHPDDKNICDLILNHMEKENIKAYDEETGRGLLRHVIIRHGTDKMGKRETMVCLVINSKPITQKAVESKIKINKLCEEIGGLYDIKSISVNFNPLKNNVILGKNTLNVWGKEKIRDTIDGLEFEISPRSFYQVNPVQMKKLYDVALDYAKLTGQEIVYDLYCGIGTISLYLARRAKWVYGVEVVEDAIKDAKANATTNSIENVSFYVGKSEEVIFELSNEPDVIVVDPPRKGCDIKCLEAILNIEPKRVVYVSCNPSTLARDLKILCEQKYEIKAVQAVDQFCHGVHVETACLLSRNN